MTTTTETISERMAREFFEASNKEAKAEQFSQDIKDGNWVGRETERFAKGRRDGTITVGARDASTVRPDEADEPSAQVGDLQPDGKVIPFKPIENTPLEEGPKLPETDVFAVDLSVDQLKQVLGIEHVCSKDLARPILCAFKVEVEPGAKGFQSLTLIGTDSYVLGRKTLVLEAPKVFTGKSDHMLVPVKEFKAAATAAIKTVGRMTGKPVRITFGSRDDGIVIKVLDEFEQRIRYTEGTFPNWKQLIGEQTKHVTPAMEGKLLPALSSVILARIAKAWDGSATSTNDKPPMRMQLHDRPEGSKDYELHMRPMSFTQKLGNQELFILVMPVRVND